MGELGFAIVGCGIAGMAQRCSCPAPVNRVHLFKRFAPPRAIGSGLLFQPTGLAALETMKALPCFGRATMRALAGLRPAADEHGSAGGQAYEDALF